MRLIVAIVAAVCVMAAVPAQEDNASPFTRWEVEQLSEVWPHIRTAGRFEDINWEAMGFRSAPGDAEARRLMEEHWGELRVAENFQDINWEATTGYRERDDDRFFASDRFERFLDDDEWGPFTEDEAEDMSEVWPDIRIAARFEDINWSQTNLGVAPGDAEARIAMARYWDELRQEPRFEDIDWSDYGY